MNDERMNGSFLPSSVPRVVGRSLATLTHFLLLSSRPKGVEGAGGEWNGRREMTRGGRKEREATVHATSLVAHASFARGLTVSSHHLRSLLTSLGPRLTGEAAPPEGVRRVPRGEKGKGNRNRPDQPVTYLRVPAAVSTLSSHYSRSPSHLSSVPHSLRPSSPSVRRRNGKRSG